MSTQSFTTLTRHAAAVISRRASLLSFGGAALGTAAAVASPSVSGAGKKGEDCKSKARQRCTRDAAGCRAMGPDLCDNDPTCIAQVTFCCDTCSANGFLTCLLGAQNTAAMARLA
jgi:hypothetical protein